MAQQQQQQEDMNAAAQAAWLPASKSALRVDRASYTAPAAGEIVIRNAAVAINPVDWFKRDSGNLMFRWIKYPFVVGGDAAGHVVAVGPPSSGGGTTSSSPRFAVGDRVVGLAVGTDQRSNKSSEGAFQTFTVLRSVVTSPIPDFVSFVEACVLPLGLSTAASGLFMKDYLALSPPRHDAAARGEAVLVWGASTSVGSNAVQLARAAGYEVYATASPKNHEFVRGLGASHVFDYKSATVVGDMVTALRGKKTAGALAIGVGSVNACIDILGQCQGRKFVAQASADLPPKGLPKSAADWLPFAMTMGYNTIHSKAKAVRRGVAVKFIWGSDPAWNEVGKMIYEDFLPRALKEKTFVPAPPPLVIGHGLEYIEEGLNLNRKGVSAQKVVVTLGQKS